MSSTVIASFGAVFGAALMIGLWAEESQRRLALRPGDAWWRPAALGVLRAEVVMVQGLLILLVTRPASWVPAAGLVVVAAFAGAGRFVRVARPRPRRRWGWWAGGASLVAVWLASVGVFLPVPGSLGERVVTVAMVAVVMCVFFLGVRGLAWCAAHLAGDRRRVSDPSEYAVVPVGSSRS